MIDQKNPTFEITYATDRDGGTEVLELSEIPYPVYKAAKPSFDDHVEKALRIIIGACATDETKVKAIGHLDNDNLTAILSIETGVARLVNAIAADVKKK